VPFLAPRLFARFRGLGPTSIDALAGLLLLVDVELQVWLNPHLDHRLPAALGGAVLTTAAAVRRRWPLSAVLVGVGAVTAQDVFGGQLTQHALGAIPAGIMLFYAAGAFLAERRAWLALALGVAVLCVDVLITTATLPALFFDGVMIGLLPWAAGRLLRERGARERASRERAERLDGEREQRARTAAYGERARIARELHDVIAHSVSVMVIQAGGARVVMDSEPERAATSLQFVERAGRDALVEMRRLLGVLDSGSDPRALAPQPGLADIDNLIFRTRAAGLVTDLRVEGDAGEVSPALDLCAYRIVQEALTNAIKHAGPARAAVCVRWGCDALELEVADDGRGPIAPDGGSGGHGIAGMRERAGLHGGSLDAGAGAGGGFVVRARLPLTPERVR
jgi:signal transduction histidine kinase